MMLDMAQQDPDGPKAPTAVDGVAVGGVAGAKGRLGWEGWMAGLREAAIHGAITTGIMTVAVVGLDPQLLKMGMFWKVVAAPILVGAARSAQMYLKQSPLPSGLPWQDDLKASEAPKA